MLNGLHGNGTAFGTVARGVGRLVLAGRWKTRVNPSRISDRLRVAHMEAPTRSGVRGRFAGIGAVHSLAVQQGARRRAQSVRLHVRLHAGIE